MASIFFDLDGTLTDPKLGITRCIQYALRQLDIDAPSQRELLWCIGPPLLASLTKLTGNEKLGRKALALYRERFAGTGLYENEVYEGVPEILAELSDKGHRLFLATSKPWVYAEKILAHFGLDRYFSTVFGSELDGRRTDKGHLLAYALGQTATASADGVMVGDRRHDIAGARQNGMTVIAVRYGYGSERELAQAKPDFWVAGIRDIPALISGMRVP